MDNAESSRRMDASASPSTPLHASRGYRLVWSNPYAWMWLITFGVVGTMCLLGTPPGSIQHAIVATVWTVFAGSVLVFSRVSITVDGTVLHVQGRLRRRAIDTAAIRRFASREAKDPWALLVFPQPVIDEWLFTVTMVHLDGSEHDLGEFVGSRRACAALAKELNRLLKR